MTGALVRNAPRWWLLTAMIGFSACGPPSAPNPSDSEAEPSTPTSESCSEIVLRAPSGDLIDLDGTWETELEGSRAGIYYFRQLGTCVWFSGAYPTPTDDTLPGALGYLTVVFRGELATDYTIRGEWVDARHQFAGHIGVGGTLELRIDFTEEGQPRIIYAGGTGEPFIEPGIREHQSWVQISTGGAYPPPTGESP